MNRKQGSFRAGRRRALAWAGSALLSSFAPSALPNSAREVRIGLTPVFLDDQIAFLNAWRDYLATRLGRPVAFVQRGSYREVVELLRREQLNFAWVCGYPYARHRDAMRLLAVPLFHGKPLYQSYLIVAATDTRSKSLLDLRGKAFAYSDPDSNSGFLYPQYSLLRAGEDPGRFFARTFFTWGHRKVVEAVAAGLAQGGAVDGYVWETLGIAHPQLTAATRIVQKSPEFGFPPFVARAAVPASEFAMLQRLLLDMDQDTEGAELLDRLNLNGFTPGAPPLFDGIARMMHAFDENRDPTS